MDIKSIQQQISDLEKKLVSNESENYEIMEQIRKLKKSFSENTTNDTRQLLQE